jgi:hypothetical protein
MSLYPNYDPHQEKLIRELERGHGWLMQRLPRILLIALAVVVVLWFASGIYMVNQGQCCAAAPPLRAKDLLKASMAGCYWRSSAVGINLRECSRVTAAIRSGDFLVDAV